jgi:hypothetical protein
MGSGWGMSGLRRIIAGEGEDGSLARMPTHAIRLTNGATAPGDVAESSGGGACSGSGARRSGVESGWGAGV